MLIYPLVFLISGVLGYVAEHYRGALRLGLTILAFIPLIILAGARSPEVGIDTDYYPLPFYYYAQEKSLIDMMRTAACEPGFSSLMWVLSRITGSFNVTLAVIQTIMIAPIIWAIGAFKVERVSIAVVTYACVVFPFSLNIMRQALAASFLLPALFFAVRRRPIPYVASVAVAALFHVTGLLGVVIWPVAIWSGFDGQKRARWAKIALFTLLVLLVFAAMFAGELLRLLTYIKESYAIQLSEVGSGSFNILPTVYPALIAAVGLLGSKNSLAPSVTQQGMLSMYMMLALSAELAFLSLISPSLSRVGQMYFIFAPCALAGLSCGDRRGRLVVCVLLALTVFSFFWIYCYGNAAGIVPYSVAWVV